MSKLLLVDGNAMLFRAYYASKYGRMMTTSNGIPTNAVYGFITMLNKAMQLIQPDYCLVAWDSGKPTFRHEKYEAYKGTRKQLDEELIVQMPIVREYLDSANLFRYEQEGIEADDIIGTMSKNCGEFETIILSSDRDLLQLIDESTKVLLMKKGITDMQVVDEAELLESFGVTPAQIIEMKGLMGDTADNIPGVPGVGEKTALTLLKQYGDVANVYAHIDEIKGKLKEKLENNKELAELSLYLATIIRDAKIDCPIEKCKVELNVQGQNEFFRKYEMNSLLIKEEEKKTEKSEISFKVVERVSESFLKENVFIHFDCDQENASIATVYGCAFAFENEVEYIEWDNFLKDERLLEFLKSDSQKVVYDAKRVYHLAFVHHFEINVSFDMMIAAFLVDGNINSYDNFVNKYQLSCESIDEVYGKKGKPKLADEEIRYAYVSIFASSNAALVETLKQELKEKEMENLFYDIEMPVSAILFEMEKNGVCCDIEVLNEIADKTLQKIDELTAQIYALAGHEFNVNSPKQLATVLYDELGLKAGKKRSTAVDVLEKLRHEHPIVELLMEQRKYQKVYSTYATGLVKHIQSDGKIHTTFNQCLTTTGRLSSSDPNLQNISVRDEEGREIRKAFVASKGNVLINADYSQIELRMLSHIAHVEKMIDAFNHHEDIHTQTAMHIFHVSKDEVTSLMRRQAKAVNFGIIYGMSAYGLSEQLGISAVEAKDFIDRYFETYPEIQVFMDSVVHECEEKGYVKTLFNRRREIKEIHDKNYMVREFGKRAAMNAPIQGSSADLIKVAMIQVMKAMKQQGLKSKLILQIHDELIFDVVEEEIEIMKELVSTQMEQAMKLSVPLVAEANVSNNWYEAK